MWSRQVGVGALVLLASTAWAQTPAGTAFTYQGRLTDNGAPADGVYDLQLTLFAVPSGGSPIGPPIVRDDVAVAAGLFTVRLDFGAAVFAGSARFLEIGVRPGASGGAFTTLAPRQELTPAPQAVFSQTAPWSGLSGVPPGFADGIDDDSGGDITSVAAGTGLVGGATSGDATVGVNFGGTGGAPTVARSDHNHDATYSAVGHDHLGQAWSGSAATALGVTTSGLTGLRGETSSAVGRGVFGLASSGTGINYGVWGESASVQGRAVIGRATASNGLSYGVWAESFSSSGRGVHGLASATTGLTYGVFGSTSSPDGTGVYGVHNSTTGTEPGVHGETESTSSLAVAVLGRVTSLAPGGNSTAIRGINEGTAAFGIGVWGSQAGGGWGVQGTTVSGIGVRGLASASGGVGVRALGSGPTGTALEISSGAIRVTNAGVGSNTVATVLVAGTTPACPPPFNRAQILDNSFSNDDPNAIVIVTASTGTSGASVAYNASGLLTCPLGRWIVFSSDATVDVGDRFNILIIKP